MVDDCLVLLLIHCIVDKEYSMFCRVLKERSTVEKKRSGTKDRLLRTLDYRVI